MRTTLDIDDDVLAAAKERAAGQKSTAGKVISDLVRQALTRPAEGPLIERNGFFVLPSRGGVVTTALVKRLEEEADLKDAGLLPERLIMRALFDVNVLIAIVDKDHVHHDAAHQWWVENRSPGWATCPLTENGMARIMSQSSYKNPIATTFAIDLLTVQTKETDHAFWPDDVSLRDSALFDPRCILGPNQITDVYLLALAVKNGGRLVTFDRSVPIAAVRHAEPQHLVTI